MKIRPVGTELFHGDGRTDRATCRILRTRLRTFWRKLIRTWEKKEPTDDTGLFNLMFF